MGLRATEENETLKKESAVSRRDHDALWLTLLVMSARWRKKRERIFVCKKATTWKVGGQPEVQTYLRYSGVLLYKSIDYSDTSANEDNSFRNHIR